MGSGEFGLKCLEALAGCEHRLSLVVTQVAKKGGRGQRLRPTAVSCWAKEKSMSCLDVENINDKNVYNNIAAVNPDLIVVIAFGQKISNELINLPSKGMINVHSSLLPKYRGAAPVNWAVINGETKTGVSIITVAEKLDSGDILAQADLDIEENETAGHVHNRLAELAPGLLLETIEKIDNGTAEYTQQDHSKATLAPKLKKSDGYIDFKEPSDILKRRILGLLPWPGASAVYVSKETNKKTRVTIVAAQCIEIQSDKKHESGTFDDKLNITCSQGALKIMQIKPAGSHIMNFKDFVNGHRVREGDKLEKINP
jgi:methionyl-tRNA formyltransferase